MTNEEGIMEFVVDSTNLDPLDASALDEDLDETEESDDDASELVVEPDVPEDPVAAALTPGAPLFMIHKSHQLAGILPEVLADISGRHSGAIHLGVIAPMPRMRPPALRSFLDRMAAAPVRIADPEAFAREDSFGPTLTAQREKPFVGPSTADHWSYFTDPQAGRSHRVVGGRGSRRPAKCGRYRAADPGIVGGSCYARCESGDHAATRCLGT